MVNETDCKLHHDTLLTSSALHSVEHQQKHPVGQPVQDRSGFAGVQRVCICGAGNAGHTMAALLASKGIYVNLFATRRQHVAKFEEDGLEVSAFYASENRTVRGTLSLVTADPEAAAKEVDLVLVVVPTFLHEEVLLAVVPFLRPKTPVVVVEGGWWSKPPLPGMDSVGFFVMEDLPWPCRVVTGHTATILGQKAFVRVGSSEATEAPRMCRLLSQLLDVNFEPAANLLSMTFFPGLLIHPGVMYGLLVDWDGKPFEKPPLFYQGVNECAEKVLLELEADLLRIKAKLRELLPNVDLSSEETLHGWYLKAYAGKIGDPSTLGSTLRTNVAYDGLVVPTQPNPNGEGRVPLYDYRYLTENSELFLMIYRGIAELAGVPTPTMDRVLEWSQAVLNREWLRDGKVQGKDLRRTRAPQAFGILTLNAFLQSVQ